MRRKKAPSPILSALYNENNIQERSYLPVGMNGRRLQLLVVVDTPKREEERLLWRLLGNQTSSVKDVTRGCDL